MGKIVVKYPPPLARKNRNKWKRREMYSKNLEKRNLKDLVVDGKILKWILKKQDMTVCPGFIWLRRGTGGRLL
jgi:hypothetical protein